MKYWETAFFKGLQRAWYAKLEAAGFEDAEEQVQGEMVLRQSAAHPLRHIKAAVQVEARQDYYSRLGELAESEDFANEIERTILTMFAAGARMKHIFEALEKLGRPSLRQRRRRCRMTIRMTIKRYEMQWGLREYTPRELNRREPRRIAS